ncbi:hypothetical protein acsn021_05120 [Anaerocolumna cellulosilytica]|uniref:Uncharacterized protein n=1 Tax=Anaerocolumna cellulosilytica TaxID=433286 RepID=A0A6S6QNL0_9FIRM|nr:hypothetical protein [Anaerocolumna cellulosilytica]MBB5195721.1 hypothetical protein [Anaerocolumna cellulosilytica]BCJ92943.1 hypothetical protein acsn021_05120 [Anaerocolumna cellulosilytica]
MGQLNETYQMLNDLIDENTKCFYRQEFPKGYEQLNNIINQLFLLTEQFRTVNTEAFKNYELLLNSKLIDIMTAISKKDVILLTDLLKYELMDILKECLEQL